MEKVYKTSETSTSDEDLNKNIPNIRIIKYEDLDKYDSIEKMLPDKIDSVIILFESKPDVGHWVCVVRIDKNIMFFDPYGYRPDKFLLFTPKYMRKRLNQDIPYLSLMLNDAIDNKLKVTFNQYPFQSRENLAYKTCGRQVISFILYCINNKNPTIKKYKVFLDKLNERHDLNYDLLVSKYFP